MGERRMRISGDTAHVRSGMHPGKQLRISGPQSSGSEHASSAAHVLQWRRRPVTTFSLKLPWVMKDASRPVNQPPPLQRTLRMDPSW